MRTHMLKIDDIDQFFCDEVDFHSDYIQLSPGPIKFLSQVVELTGITLYWNHFGARMRIREAYMGDETLIFGFVFPSDKPFLYRGREFQPDHAVIQQPGAEHEYICHQGLRSLMIYMDRSLITDTGLHFSDAVEKTVPMKSLRALVSECRSATRAIQQLDASRSNKTIENMLRNKIIARLLEALQPWSAENHQDNTGAIQASREFLLVKQAEKEMFKIGLATRPTADQLAGILEVSKRTLFYAFNKWAGIGPNAYFEIMRLHYVRDRLQAGSNATTRVTDAASELGFSHLGRFAGRYYEFFGEHPSETLARDLI